MRDKDELDDRVRRQVDFCVWRFKTFLQRVDHA